jgi:hypothetical protein
VRSRWRPRALDLSRAAAAGTRALALLAREQERIPAAGAELRLLASSSPPATDGSPPAGPAGLPPQAGHCG